MCMSNEIPLHSLTVQEQGVLQESEQVEINGRSQPGEGEGGEREGGEGEGGEREGGEGESGEGEGGEREGGEGEGGEREGGEGEMGSGGEGGERESGEVRSWVCYLSLLYMCRHVHVCVYVS